MLIGNGFKDCTLSETETAAIVEQALRTLPVDGKRVLVLIPDGTRSMPMPLMFCLLQDALARRVAALDFLIALGTHQPMSDAQKTHLIGRLVTDGQAGRSIIFNHEWGNPANFTTIGIIPAKEISQITQGMLAMDVPVSLNRMIDDYDHLIICGPVFPHEVVGFSGGNKYLFPGIAGAEIINFTHWLGALATVRGTIGIKDTPVRAVIHAATRRLQTPSTLVALSTEGAEIAGVLIGDVYETWDAAADEAEKLHVKWCDHPYKSVLSGCPPMYDELWTAGKCMYKMESAVEIGGELIIYAPHLDVVSPVHGKYIYEAGYHILPYFLNDWDKYKHLPLGALAHCTHVRGSGVMENGVERPNVRLILASKIPPEDCAKLNLGYRDPATINPADWENREDEGYLYVPRAGEMLYKVRGQK